MKEKHRLIITNFKTSLGFKADCTCGQRISRVTRCNGSGRMYGLQAAEESFEEHLQEVTNDKPD